MEKSNIEVLKITDLKELAKMSKGEVVSLPGFTEEPFVCRLKRPSLLDLVASGTIPNNLLSTAYKIFYGESNTKLEKKEQAQHMKEHGELLQLIAEKSFVEPTYNEIIESGLSLNDLQLMAIFNYSQQGAKVLEPFRKK